MARLAAGTRKLIVPSAASWSSVTNTAVTMAGSAIAAIGTGSVTIEGWLKMPSGSVPAGIFGINKSGSGSDSGLFLYNSAGAAANRTLDIRYATTGARAVLSVANFHRHNRWVHMAVVLDSSDGRCKTYRDGALVDNSAISWNLENTSIAVIGQSLGLVGHTPGMGLSRFRVYTRALSLTDVQNRFYAFLDDSAMRTSIQMDYLLTEGSGTSAADSSGNARTLTVPSGNWTTDAPFKARAA